MSFTHAIIIDSATLRRDASIGLYSYFHRAMHISAKRGIAIVILSVRLSVFNIRAL